MRISFLTSILLLLLLLLFPTLNFFILFVILFGGQYSHEPLGSYHVYEEQTKINVISVNHENLKNDQGLMSGNTRIGCQRLALDLLRIPRNTKQNIF